MPTIYESVQCGRRVQPLSLGQNSWIILNRPGLHASLACGGGQWGRQEAGAPSPLGPGTWLSSVVLPAATRGCPPRLDGARRDARVPGFYSLVHSGFCFSMNAFMPIFWSLVEKVE